MVETAGIEPATFRMQTERSTTELRPHYPNFTLSAIKLKQMRLFGG